MPAHAQTIEDERRALAVAKAQSVEANKRADRLAAQAAAERDAAKQARAKAATLASRIQSSEADTTAAEARIRLIEQLRARQRAKLAAKQEPAVRLIAALQMMARRPPVLALVRPGSTRDLVHVRAVLASMLPLVKARTVGLRADVEAGRKLRADADLALKALGDSQARLRAQRAELIQLAANRRLASQRLSNNALSEQDRAIALGERARDIVDLMDRITEAASVRATLETLPGPVLRPARPGDPRATPVDANGSSARGFTYLLPVAGNVVTGLGEVSDAGVRARGLTIAARPSAQVVAPAEGRVAFAGVYRGFGRIVIIDHGQGLTTLITSLVALDVGVGDTVVEGSPIGRAGPDRPTVTIELRRNGQPVDITPLL